MPQQEQYELQVRNSLTASIIELNDLETDLTNAAKSPGTRAPAQLKEIMKKVGSVLQECEQIIEDHANGTITVSNDLLLVTAGALRAAHEVISAVALLEAVR